MSGIAAIVQTGLMCQSEAAESQALIATMASIMTTRGPDAQHYWAKDNAALIHTLLRQGPDNIGKAQPCTLDERCWITSEARIDDRAHLIERLRQAGHSIEIDAEDSQLILSAYRQWSLNCLDHLMGDFAFIIWDIDTQRLFCATDQFGVVPLYYSALEHSADTGLVVSNTLNAIRVHPDIANTLDEMAIADYLQWRTNENPQGTIFEKIKRLPAAHCLVLEKGRLTVSQYWQLPPRQAFYNASLSTYAEEFKGYLNQAVTDRIRSDYLGVHLSGGMDSTSITALTSHTHAQHRNAGRLIAYTYKPRASDMDLESPHAQTLAQTLGIEHRMISEETGAYETDPLPTELLPPEPSFTYRESNRFRLLNHIGGYGNLLLTGFGGDPLLKSTGVRVSELLKPESMLLLMKMARSHWQIYRTRPHLGLNRSKRNFSPKSYTWLQGHFVNSLSLAKRYQAIADERRDPTRHLPGMVQDALWRRIFSWHDPGFSHIPVRVRHPFFDLRLLTYARDLPPFPMLYDKHVLRQAMAGTLPDSILQRPKTPMPGSLFALQLQERGINQRLLSLLNAEPIQEYVDTRSLINRLDCIHNADNIDFKRLMRTATLSDWLNGYLAVPDYWRKQKRSPVLKRLGEFTNTGSD